MQLKLRMTGLQKHCGSDISLTINAKGSFKSAKACQSPVRGRWGVQHFMIKRYEELNKTEIIMCPWGDISKENLLSPNEEWVITISQILG